MVEGSRVQERERELKEEHFLGWGGGGGGSNRMDGRRSSSNNKSRAKFSILSRDYSDIANS